MLCAEVVSAVDDPHVSTVTRESFDLWRTGWLTFVQVLLASVELSKVLVLGDVRPYGGVRINAMMRANPDRLAGRRRYELHVC